MALSFGCVSQVLPGGSVFSRWRVFLLASLAVSFQMFVGLTTQAQTPTPLQFVPLPVPCRAVDTRLSGGAIAGGTSRTFNLAGGECDIQNLGTGVAYAVNFTVVPHGSLGYLTVWPTGAAMPNSSILNSYDGRVKADGAILGAGSDGTISAYATDTTDLVIDVSGYFTSATNQYVFVPMTPCRVVDTRLENSSSFGAPSLSGGQQRQFQLLNSSCNIPSSALASGGAVSLNITAIPKGYLGYLTVWGTSASQIAQPNTSILNSYSGTVVANAAIVPINPSTLGSISVYSTDDTDIAIDLNGYFEPANLNPSGLSFFASVPCRVLDTRFTGGAFQGTLAVPVSTGNNCSVSTIAQAYVFNATVVPSGYLGYLTLWPDQVTEPNASTLNSYDGSVTSNMAIVRTTNGSIDAAATSPTQLILDLSGYFAPPPPIGPASQILFIGDSITSAWLTPDVLAQNPNWHIAPPPTDPVSEADAPNYTTYDLVNGLQAALASCPRCTVVHILAGSWDYLSGGDEFIHVPCPNITPSGAYAEYPPSLQTTCQNIQTMVQAAQDLGKAVIVGTLPPLGPNVTNPEVANLLNYIAQFLYEDIGGLNSGILYSYGALVPDPYAPGVQIGKQGVHPGSAPVLAAVDYNLALADLTASTDPGLNFYVPAYTIDGVLPSQAGGQVMTQQLNLVLQEMGATSTSMKRPDQSVR